MQCNDIIAEFAKLCQIISFSFFSFFHFSMFVLSDSLVTVAGKLEQTVWKFAGNQRRIWPILRWIAHWISFLNLTMWRTTHSQLPQPTCSWKWGYTTQHPGTWFSPTTSLHLVHLDYNMARSVRSWYSEYRLYHIHYTRPTIPPCHNTQPHYGIWCDQK